jgi:AcrR family transcriptional regulator
MELFAKQANISKTTALYHFKTRQDLLNEVVSTVYQEGVGAITPRVQQAASCEDKLYAYITANIEYIAAHPRSIIALQQILSDYAGRKATAIQAEVALQTTHAVKPLVDIMTAGQQNGEFITAFDPTAATLAIRHLIDGASTYIAYSPTLDIGRYSHELANFCIRSIKK